jgi:hypothetical protein
VAAVVLECALASAKDGYIALKALEHCLKAANFTAGAVEVLVIP